jgi:hypothetical protein
MPFYSARRTYMQAPATGRAVRQLQNMLSDQSPIYPATHLLKGKRNPEQDRLSRREGHVKQVGGRVCDPPHPLVYAQFPVCTTPDLLGQVLDRKHIAVCRAILYVYMCTTIGGIPAWKMYSAELLLGVSKLNTRGPGFLPGVLLAVAIGHRKVSSPSVVYPCRWTADGVPWHRGWGCGLR